MPAARADGFPDALVLHELARADMRAVDPIANANRDPLEAYIEEAHLARRIAIYRHCEITGSPD